MSANIKRLSQAGFSIVELVIAAAVAGILSVTAITVMLFFYGDVIRSNTQAELAVESQNILRSVVEELRVSSSIKEANSISDDNSPAGGWTTSNENLILIISTPALNSDDDFIVNPETGLAYQNEIVYFADGDSLYRRTLAHPEATGNTATTTCPKALASSSCPADTVMSSNFEDMNFIFYNQDDAITNDLTTARSIELIINMHRRSFGKDLRFTNSIRITLRNTV